jgi:DNA-binding NarL/FixJ family response regulator
MKKINITIVIAGKEDYPGCADILATCPEFHVVACPTGLYEAAAWTAISQSDVVLLDEAVLERDGVETVRRICDSYPLLKLLLLMERENEARTLEALSLGISGVMERASMVSMLRKAIPVLYSGEAWVSRGLVHSLRNYLNELEGNSYLAVVGGMRPGQGKLN